MFVIEHDVPPPAAAKGPAVYGFERLRVGDSFLVPATVMTLTTVASRVRWALKKYRRTHANDTKWRTAANTKGVRVWRIA